MVTVLRSRGLRIVIYTDDHEPAHVHLFGDGEAKVDLVTMMVLENRGMKKGELRRALAVVSESRTVLLERWNEIHG